MQDIVIHTDRALSGPQLASIFARAGLNRRTQDAGLMQKMADTADLLITAWDGDKLVGVARSLSDFCAVCYLADLAVDRDYQQRGIGAALTERTRGMNSPATLLLLLAAPSAMNYYPKIGFAAVDNGWIIRPPQPQ
ncbi:GNAT family N-acetyltransferase [Janthinobacterium agaricidamnosum]|uniref:Acetyltransferase family protein n=1 Tax=Janthinobacterium agaricidamnosum NBRC 102515 = DSM 9628 TaxID=1349767 RepID=W0VDM4_9BURK|nr:GNAT family N-acetyltransferase [Janthinobacterium agaricidamnosum]CDG85407.1 acetyltransferase family protein [Janthinobacterium agaricidamnosum NBRC 102515 = DSM 9628]